MDVDPSTRVTAAAAQFNAFAPLPRGGAVPGPPALFPSIAAVPVLRAWAAEVDPLTAQIADDIRGAVARSPQFLADLAASLPSPQIVAGGVAAGLGLASLAAGASGAAAQLLAPVVAGVPYLGAATAAWAALGQPVAAGLGFAGGAAGALAQGGNMAPAFWEQWGKLAQNLGAAAGPAGF